MQFKKIHWIGIVFGAIIILIDLIFFNTSSDRNLFLFLLGLAFSVIALPFIIGLIIENKKEQKINEMFLEFSRNLAESVGVGTPVSKSIVNMKNKNYGPLTPHIVKLANQINIGIPVSKAMQTFAYEVGSPVVTRAIGLISEAEKAGGEIDYILESSAKSIAEIEKLKKERKTAVYNLIVQGYIIFFIFIGIMLVIEFKILPLTAGIGSLNLQGGLSFDTGSLNESSNIGQNERNATAQELANPFLYLLLAQGFFAGLIIGKLTEGSIKAGIKHSFILTITALLVSTGVRVLFG